VESGTLRIEKEMGGYINWILDVGCKWDWISSGYCCWAKFDIRHVELEATNWMKMFNMWLPFQWPRQELRTFCHKCCEIWPIFPVTRAKLQFLFCCSSIQWNDALQEVILKHKKDIKALAKYS
jgi:hypothetical protein